MCKKKLFNISPKNFSKEAKLILKKNFNYSEIKTKNELLKKVGDCEILFTRIEYDIDKKILNKASNLRIIATNTTGLNHIDLNLAKNKKIKVISLNDSRQELMKISASAEFTWAILLCLVRQISNSVESVKKGIWDREKFKGIQLKNKNLGIIGMGRNGSQIRKYGKSFGMKIYSWDKYKKKKTNCLLDKLLKKSDFIILCIPSNKENINFFNKEKLNKVKVGAILVNTSRGEILDESELLNQLKKKKLNGAALDVLQMKKNKPKNLKKFNNYQMNNSNLIITPHIAGVTKESWSKSEIIVAKKLIGMLNEGKV